MIGKIQVVITDKQLNNLNNRILKATTKAGNNSMYWIARNFASALRKKAIAENLVGTGYLSSTKGTHEKRIKANDWVVVMPYYTKFLEMGTQPHTIPITPRIALWARRKAKWKGKNPYVLRRSIEEKGTEPHPFTNEVFEQEHRKFEQKIRERFTKELLESSREIIR